MPKGYPKNGINTSWFKKGNKTWCYGKKLSPEHRKKLSEAKLKNPTRYWLGKKRNLKGHKISEETRQKISKTRGGGKWGGEKHWHWKGGISRTKEYKAFYDKLLKKKRKLVSGFHTLKEWQTLKAQYNFTCPCCHKSEPEIKLTEDHIIPISRGGSDNIENIQPLCGRCNSKKNTKIIKYYYELLLR